MNDRLSCPRCAVALKPERVDDKTAWACASCAGLAINLAALRASAQAAIVNALWQLGRVSSATALPCPSCKQPLRLVHYADHKVELEADLCIGCQLMWLDHGELDAIRQRPAPQPRPSAPEAFQLSFSAPRPADDLRGIGTAADLVDLVLRIIWSTFR